MTPMARTAIPAPIPAAAPVLNPPPSDDLSVSLLSWAALDPVDAVPPCVIELVVDVLLLVPVAVVLELEVDAPVEEAPAEDGIEVSKRARVGEINSPLAARGLEAHAWFMVSTKLPMTTLSSCAWRHRAQSAA